MSDETLQLTPASADEDLREFYITPLYLETMGSRVKEWTDEHIKNQIRLFRRTIGDYPEVLELLEGELHKRHLNTLYRHIKKSPNSVLEQLLEKLGDEPDYREIIETELEIRGGAKHLHDSSGET